jgi:hypothetical protein
MLLTACVMLAQKNEWEGGLFLWLWLINSVVFPCCEKCSFVLLYYQKAAAVVVALFVWATHHISSVSAVLYGDEQFGNLPGGRFWAFHSAGVSIVNPESCRVEHTFSTDDQGSPLPDTWNDGVYMETSSSPTDPTKTKKSYVVINSGVTKFDSHENLEGGSGEVIVFSADPKDYDSNPVKSKVVVGGQPVHSYAVYTRDEVSSVS